MTDFIHVYIDDKNVIREIELSNITTFDQYEHITIPNSDAKEIQELYQKWEQHPSIKNNKFMLLEIDGIRRVKKAVYIYYHFKDKSIRSITPRKQEALDDDGDLRCGLVPLNELLTECINGTKSMINCRVNTDDDVLVFEEIPVETFKFDVINSITLLEDYEVKDINDVATINITYDGNELIIKRTNECDISKKYELFFIDRFDKTLFYESVVIMFTEDQTELCAPFTLGDVDYMVISPYKTTMTFIEV